MKFKSFYLLFLVGALSSCGANNSAFNFESDFTKGYNKNLWYKNDLEQLCADPSIIYNDEDGYYYMYMTSDELGCAGFNVYRSKQLNYWEQLAPAFIPDPYSWGLSSLWAPNIIKIGDLYYLYYSAFNHTTKQKGMSVAVSSSPAGPFHEYEGFDANGRTITRNDQIFNWGFPAIDAAPFIDTDGQLYLYFSKDQVNRISSCYGVKMIDPVTPDMSTLKELAVPGKVNVNAESLDLTWELKSSGGRWNEAPTMLKIDNTYYLTYSANYFEHTSYGVGYAMSNSPLGDFVKPNNYENENLLLGVDPLEQMSAWDLMSGPGHHCFFYAGDELMIGYHAHTDRIYGASIRAFALDKVYVNEDKTLFVNGPTYSLQPLPESVSGYRNVAKEANITITNNVDPSKLIDDRIPMHLYRNSHVNLQTLFKAGNYTITLEFNNPVKTTAVALYNSLNFETALKQINTINVEGYAFCKDIKMNSDYMDYYYQEYMEEYIRPGASFVAEYFEHDTKKITIEFSSDKDFALSEIVVLGR